VVKVSVWDGVVHALLGDGQSDCIAGPYSKGEHVHVDDPILNTPPVCCPGVGKDVNPDWGNYLVLGGDDQGDDPGMGKDR